MNLRLERLVWRRAGRVCEYCQMPLLWDGPRLVGLTTIGRATIAVLEINLRRRIALRQALIDEGLFPPVVAEQLSAPARRNPKRIAGGFKR